MSNLPPAANFEFELEASWRQVLSETLKQPYIAKLNADVEKERQSGALVYPSRDLVFNAFAKTPFDKVKVVIVGQDPYHGPGQAHGLSFSVPKGIPLPPSLKNIVKELMADVAIPQPSHGCLVSWAEQGVLLLNATLTVRGGEPLSHHKIGWELFTDAVIEKLLLRKEPVIFVLWGKNAQDKCRILLERDKIAVVSPILMAAHPSPFSAHRGFLGCRHFSKINDFLIQNGEKPINWEIK